MAVETIMGQPPEPHYPSWYAAQIEKLPAAQPDHVADSGKKADGDCISRRAALDAITDELMPSTPLSAVIRVKNRLKELPSAQPEQVCVANVTLTDEQVKEVVEKAKNAVISVIELEPHWIPVSERLPDDDKEVLLCINNGELWLGWHNITWKTEEFYFDKEQVIAWMPLPEPYKGGEM
jgi:hypothetical protein